MVVVSAGIKPNTDVAVGTGLTVERALVVDDQMRSIDDRNVYVVGECAQHRGQVYGLVAPLWEQAKVLADHVTGTNLASAYHGSRVATKLKVMGVDVASMGLVEPQYPEDEVVQFSEAKRGTYKKLIVRDGRLVGGILLGDISKAPYLMQAFDRNTPLPEQRLQLLFDIGAPAKQVTFLEMSPETQVCNCNGVSKRDLVACVNAGKRTLKSVMDATRAGMGCGSCKMLVAEIVEWACDGEVEEDPVRPLLRARRAARQARTDRGRARAQPALGVCRVRLPCRRRGGRREQAGAGVAAQDDLEGRVRRRARRALHQRPRPRQYPARRHVLGDSADARRRHHARTSCGALPTWPNATRCRW